MNMKHRLSILKKIADDEDIKIAEKIMGIFGDISARIMAKHKISVLDREKMDEHKREFYDKIMQVFGGRKYSQEVYKILEENNFHFLNEALEILGLFEDSDKNLPIDSFASLRLSQRENLLNMTNVEEYKRAIESLPLPFVNARISTLGGPENVSILFTISLDKKEDWPNNILENSKYGKYHLETDGSFSQISGKGMEKLRKNRVKGIEDLITKINRQVTLSMM